MTSSEIKPTLVTTDEPSSTQTASTAAAAVPPSHRLASDDGRWLISFHWRNDRYDHVVATAGGAKHESLLRSVNGSTDEDWPASPAIQQLSTETIEGRPTVLGVGCCGTSHFSVSVQNSPDPAGNPAVRFDWAVRLSKELDEAAIAAIDGFWLGTTYKAAVRRTQDTPRKSWRLECGETAALENIRDGETTLHRLRPTSVAGQRTIQWSYWITGK